MSDTYVEIWDKLVLGSLGCPAFIGGTSEGVTLAIERIYDKIEEMFDAGDVRPPVISPPFEAKHVHPVVLH